MHAAFLDPEKVSAELNRNQLAGFKNTQDLQRIHRMDLNDLPWSKKPFSVQHRFDKWDSYQSPLSMTVTEETGTKMLKRCYVQIHLNIVENIIIIKSMVLQWTSLLLLTLGRFEISLRSLGLSVWIAWGKRRVAKHNKLWFWHKGSKMELYFSSLNLNKFIRSEW